MSAADAAAPAQGELIRRKKCEEIVRTLNSAAAC